MIGAKTSSTNNLKKSENTTSNSNTAPVPSTPTVNISNPGSNTSSTNTPTTKKSTPDGDSSVDDLKALMKVIAIADFTPEGDGEVPLVSGKIYKVSSLYTVFHSI